MKIGTFGRGMTLAVLYIGILLGIVVFQFRGGGDFFLASSGLTLRGRPGGEAGSIEAGTLGFGGLALVFSPDRPLSWTAQDGARRTSLPRSFQRNQDGFRMLFTDGIELNARASGAPGSRAEFHFSRRTGPLRDVVVAMAASRRSHLVQVGGKYYITGSAGRFALDVPDGAVASDRGTLTLPFERGRVVPAVLSKTDVSLRPAPLRFLEQAPLDPAVFQSEIASFREKTWRGLSGARFLPETVEWRNAAGRAAFSETALTAYLAEAWSRGQGPAAFARVRAANTLHSQALTHLSVPFMGRTAERMRVFEEADLAEVRRVERLVQTRSPTLLEKPGLTQFLLNRTPYALARDAFAMVKDLDVGSLTVSQAVGGLAAWAEASDLFSPEENPFARFAALPERLILPAVVKAGDDFFLTSGPDGSAHLETSIRAGLALIRLGQSSEKPMFVGIGQSLVLGALRLADSFGFMPGTVVVRNGAVADRLDVLAPEDLYPLVAGNPYYPRQVSFYREVGPGSWMWTSSPSVTVSATAERMIWTVEYPVRGVHFMAAYGVLPFTRMQLYGVDYPMDPAFETYDASGYLYRRAANVVYFKMLHRTRIEEIRMFF